jgi:hypothetical protein
MSRIDRSLGRSAAAYPLSARNRSKAFGVCNVTRRGASWAG